jgi:hypothetical protein
MARFHVDANVAIPFADLLSAQGHDVATARQLSLANAPDDKHLLDAAQANRVVITHNEKDFILLHGAWRRWSAAWGIAAITQHAGILVLPVESRTRSRGQVTAIERLVADRGSLVNELHVWRSTVWEHYP